MSQQSESSSSHNSSRSHSPIDQQLENQLNQQEAQKNQSKMTCNTEQPPEYQEKFTQHSSCPGVDNTDLKDVFINGFMRPRRFSAYIFDYKIHQRFSIQHQNTQKLCKTVKRLSVESIF